jgi:hypothetical protein
MARPPYGRSRIERSEPSCASCAFLVVIVTGVFVANLDDLTAVIHAAMAAHKMRALRLMTLGALDGRYRA